MDHLIVDNAAEPGPSQRGSRATSPGGCWRELKNTRVIEVSGLSGINGTVDGAYSEDEDDTTGQRLARYRPRTFPYQRYLPYRHYDHQHENLENSIKQLYIAVSAGDFVPGATHWTREIRGWMNLKFNLPRQTRVKLARLYYELALAPGMESSAAERFSGMFMTLTK